MKAELEILYGKILDPFQQKEYNSSQYLQEKQLKTKKTCIGGIGMKDEYTADDFAKGIKNPFFEKLNKETEVAVRNEVYQVYKEVGEKSGVEPELIMRRALEQFAKILVDDSSTAEMSRNIIEASHQ